MRLQVLGRLQVVDSHHGTAPAVTTAMSLGGARQQHVLAVLLASVNSVVSTGTLVDEVWADSPPAAARHTLQGYVSELRKVLGSAIARDGPGYIVRADEDTLDSLEFEQLVGRGRESVDGDVRTAADSFRAALRLWRGQPYAGLDGRGVLAAERTRLEELRLSALEDWAVAELALGHHRQMAADLGALCREYPYREGLRAQHMIALYRSGLQADALRAFQQSREVLADELGLDPSPLLRRLEEQILVHDPSLDLLDGENQREPTWPTTHPYMGLRAFTEADADVFYGREALAAELVRAATGTHGFTAVVGPSGSGKSSIVQAGLVPTLRSRDGPSASWCIALMRPGASPFTELEAALKAAVDQPRGSVSLLWDPGADLARAVLGVLPQDGSLLLVIDQFEELYTLVDERQREAFLRGLVALATDPSGRTRVLVTLRADFYDRPLLHAELGRLMSGHVVDILPLAADELEAAAVGPANHVGVTFERGLIAALVADVSGQPNALPLFQYTLSELFERRSGSVMTMTAYQSLGGIRGAVARGAEEVYQRLGSDERQAAHQLFLRLVTVGRDSATRRVLPASELVSLDVDTVTVHGAVEAFAAARLLVRDRDAVTGSPTVEVAHEALLAEWERLRRWIEDGRGDLREHAALSLAIDDWLAAGRDDDTLLTGARLDRFERWAATTNMRLTALERSFLDGAVGRRDEAAAVEAARSNEQARLRRHARVRAFALGAAAAATVAATAAVLVVTAGTAERPVIAIASSVDLDGGEPGAQLEQGLVRAERDFGLIVDRHDLPADRDDAAADVAELTDAGDDLLILDTRAGNVAQREDLDPDTSYVLVDHYSNRFAGVPNVTIHSWANEHAGYLAGVAAAATTRTGTVGFIGAAPYDPGQEEYRAGFEAGAKATDGDTKVLAAYLTSFGYRQQPYDAAEGARLVADRIFESGADIIFHVAGSSGDGVLQAALGLSVDHRWVIGAETDQWQTATTRERLHVLTSVVRRVDQQVYDIIGGQVDGSLAPGEHRLSAADGMISYTSSGDNLSPEARTALDRAGQELASGSVRPPRTPTTEPVTVEALNEPDTGTALFAGARDVPVSVSLPPGWRTEEYFVSRRGDTQGYGLAFVEVANIYADPCRWDLLDPPVGPTIDDLTRALTKSTAWRAGAPSDVVVDGYEGTHLTFTLPAYDPQDCSDGLFGLFKEGGRFGVTSGTHPNVWAVGPQQHNEVWILDVDGERLVILAATFPDTPPAEVADLESMMASLRIG